MRFLQVYLYLSFSRSRSIVWKKPSAISREYKGISSPEKLWQPDGQGKPCEEWRWNKECSTCSLTLDIAGYYSTLLHAFTLIFTHDKSDENFQKQLRGPFLNYLYKRPSATETHGNHIFCLKRFLNPPYGMDLVWNGPWLTLILHLSMIYNFQCVQVPRKWTILNYTTGGYIWFFPEKSRFHYETPLWKLSKNIQWFSRDLLTVKCKCIISFLWLLDNL